MYVQTHKKHKLKVLFVVSLWFFAITLVGKILSFHSLLHPSSLFLKQRKYIFCSMTELGKRNFKTLAAEDKPKITFVTGNKKK
jgi:hypothetical protein